MNRLDFLYQSNFYTIIWYKNSIGKENRDGSFIVEYKEEIDRLAKEFESCQKILLALGDENRQHLILEMIQMEQCNGVRVGTITEKTHLSRPAVSHHIQILKEAGILKVRKEGTKNYYYFDADTQAFNQLIHMLVHAKEIMERLSGWREANLS